MMAHNKIADLKEKQKIRKTGKPHFTNCDKTQKNDIHTELYIDWAKIIYLQIMIILKIITNIYN